MKKSKNLSAIAIRRVPLSTLRKRKDATVSSGTSDSINWESMQMVTVQPEAYRLLTYQEGILRTQ